AAAAVLDEMRSAGTALALEAAWSGQPGRSRLTGLALVPAAAAGSPEAAAPEEALTAHWLDVELLSDQQVVAALASLVGPGGPTLHAHRAKELMRGLSALGARGRGRLYDDVERPLVRVLARMEEAGVRVDAEYLRGVVANLTEETQKLDTEIQDTAGHPFVVNSTKQLRTVLFEELGLQP